MFAATALALLIAGAMNYEIFISKAFTQVYIGSIVVGVIGVVMLVIAVVALPKRLALATVCYYIGLSATVCSAVILFLIAQPWLMSGIGQQWEALVPFSLALTAMVAFSVMKARADRQKRRSSLGPL